MVSFSTIDIIHLINGMLGVLSFICSFLLMIIIAFLQRHEKSQTKLNHIIFWMSFSDCCLASLASIIYLGDFFIKDLFLYNNIFSNACILFFAISVQSWYFMITIELFVMVSGIKCNIKKKRREPCWKHVKTKRCFHHVYVWVVSTAGTFLGVSLDVTSDFRRYTPLLAAFSIMLGFYFFFALIVFFTVVCAVRKQHLMKRITVLVGVFFITWFPVWVLAVIDGLILNRKRDQVPPWLLLAGKGLGCASGILNFIVWVIFSPKLRNQCRSAFGKKKHLNDSVPMLLSQEPLLSSNSMQIKEIEEKRASLGNYAS